MSRNSPTTVIFSNEQTSETIPAFCQYCGKPVRLSSSLQRFCSEACKDSFNNGILDLRKKKRNEYQKQFRSTSYKTQVKHLRKVVCPKCNQEGYLVKYTVRNIKTGRTVSIYETVRHQVTIQGKSILRGQCYVRSLPREENGGEMLAENSSDGRTVQTFESSQQKSSGYDPLGF